MRIRDGSDTVADDDGEIDVDKGDRIPGILENMLKLSTSLAVTRQLVVGVEIVYNSGQFLRSDEANLLVERDDFAIANLRRDYQISESLTVIAPAIAVIHR